MSIDLRKSGDTKDEKELGMDSGDMYEVMRIRKLTEKR